MVRLQNPFEIQEDLTDYYKIYKRLSEELRTCSLSVKHYKTCKYLRTCMSIISIIGNSEHRKDSLKVSVTIALAHEKET